VVIKGELAVIADTTLRVPPASKALAKRNIPNNEQSSTLATSLLVWISKE
jgi:hypothetical protein